MRCIRCGNANSEENRFCGMCGSKLEPTSAVVASAALGASTTQASVRKSAPLSRPASVPGSAQRASVARPAASAPPLSQDEPVIGGQPFLGLKDPAPRKRRGVNGDSQSSSSSLDYELEDEEPRRGGAGKPALILLALALAAGFGYLRWNWLIGTSKRPAVASQTPDPPATTYVLPSSNDTSPLPTPAQTPTQPVRPATQPAADSSFANTPTAAPGAGDRSSLKTDAAAPGDTPNSSSDSATTEPSIKEPAGEQQAKPHTGITPSRSADSVTEAQKYIYGRGVTQDCGRGMRLLKPAATQANPKAMIEMGALYSAGLCAPHDLPTAYRWFAMALRKEPDNQFVQADLHKIWGEMTQPERQLAIRLSQ